MNKGCCIAVMLLFFIAGTVLPASAFTPWRTMIKAGKDERKGLDIRQDSVLKREVASAIKREKGLAGADIHIAVYMGHAFLVGTVSGGGQPEKARDIAAGTHGVRSVSVYLPVRSKITDSEDAPSSMEAEGALLTDPFVVASRYEVRMVGATAVIMGIAGSAEQKQRAVEDVQGVDGVSEVVDFILLPEPEYEKRARQRLGILR